MWDCNNLKVYILVLSRQIEFPLIKLAVDIWWYCHTIIKQFYLQIVKNILNSAPETVLFYDMHKCLIFRV